MQHQPPSSRLPRRVIALLAALIMTLGLTSAIRPLTPPAHADAATTDGEFVPLWTAPLLATKTGTGTPNGQAQKVPAGGTMTFQALGQGGLPTSGVSAASLKVHALTPTSTGFLSVYPSDKPTTISTVSFTTGESSTNADFTQITATGQITVANSSDQPLDVLIAVDGYFKSGGAATTVYKPLSTAVLWDTRAEFTTGSPAVNTPLPAQSSTEVQVAGQAGIPTQCDQSAAVALNIVALNQTTDGELKVEPTDAPVGVGTLQFTANDWNNSTFSIVQMGCSGKLRVTNSSAGTVNVSISVRGYFTYWDADDRGARYKPVEPATVLDTAAGTGTGGSTTPMNGESHRVFDATGPSGVPVNTVSAVAMQIKVINPTAGGWITFRPEDQPEIPISSLVYQQGENASGFETQIPSGLGRIAITNHGTASVHVQITVRGFYIHKTVEVIEGEMPEIDPNDYSFHNAEANAAADERAAVTPGLGPVSYDPVTKKVITTASTPEKLAEAAQPITVPVDPLPYEVPGDEGEDPGLPEDTEVEDAPEPTTEPERPTTTITPLAVLAPNSAPDLQAVKNAIHAIDPATLPETDNFQGVYVEEKKNRVIIETSSASPAVVGVLTGMFGPSKVALRIVEPFTGSPEYACNPSRYCLNGTQPANRQLAGGMPIRLNSSANGDIECTAGFKYKVGSNNYILTAGHCGGNGTVWGTGELDRFGQTTGTNFSRASFGGSLAKTSPCCTPLGERFSGDLSLVKIDSGKYTQAVVYKNSTQKYKVKGAAEDHRENPRDKHTLCVSGARTGQESCWWKTKETDFELIVRGPSLRRVTRPLVVARKQASSQAACGITHADSGAPVYSLVGDGTIWARGILQGGDYSNGTCTMRFTNIAEARWVSGGRVVRANLP